jgi:hypothetical protein
VVWYCYELVQVQHGGRKPRPHLATVEYRLLGEEVDLATAKFLAEASTKQPIEWGAIRFGSHHAQSVWGTEVIANPRREVRSFYVSTRTPQEVGDHAAV